MSKRVTRQKSAVKLLGFLMEVLVGAVIILASLGASDADAVQKSTIACGQMHTLAIGSDGSLWAWGYNGDGELGLGNYNDQHSPVKVMGTVKTWTAVAAGDQHSLGLRADGTLWAWGNNGSGQLGLGNTNTQLTPTQVAGTWVAIAAGSSHSLAIKADGTLWAWGWNTYGQLGVGNYSGDTSIPVRVGNASNWVAVASSGSSGSGGDYSLGLRSDGTLWAWGDNSSGELGQGYADSNTHNTPIRVGNASNWKAVAAGAWHCLGLRSDGSLWSWGYNDQGELGQGNHTVQYYSPTRVGSATWMTIAAGSRDSLGVRSDGTLWAWGANYAGELGKGDTNERDVPTKVGTATNWWAVAAGDQYSLGLRRDRFLWASGYNNVGQLGVGYPTDQYYFVKVSELYYLSRALPWLELLD